MWSAMAPRPRGAGCGGGPSPCDEADRVSTNRFCRGEKNTFIGCSHKIVLVFVFFLSWVAIFDLSLFECIGCYPTAQHRLAVFRRVKKKKKNHAVSRWNDSNLCQHRRSLLHGRYMYHLLSCYDCQYMFPIVPFPSLLISSVGLWHISALLSSSGRPPLVYMNPVVAFATLWLVWYQWRKKLLISGLGLIQPISGRLLSRRGRLNEPGHRPVIYR